MHLNDVSMLFVCMAGFWHLHKGLQHKITFYKGLILSLSPVGKKLIFLSITVNTPFSLFYYLYLFIKDSQVTPLLIIRILFYYKNRPQEFKKRHVRLSHLTRNYLENGLPEKKFGSEKNVYLRMRFHNSNTT